MFASVYSWFHGNDNERVNETKYTLGNRHLYENDDIQQGFHLRDEELQHVKDRIKQCLNDDSYYDTNNLGLVDETLRLMRDETRRWDEYHDDHLIPDTKIGDFAADKLDKDGNTYDNTDAAELVGYCIRLERNNEYLLQLVEKFEQVSFKKRYSELLLSNERLQNEFQRLKVTNGKVYTSYCDLIEEMKKCQSENESLKRQLSRSKRDIKEKLSESTKLEVDFARLKLENEEYANKMHDLRKSNMQIRKEISIKEEENNKLRGENIALKLKLEKAENVLLNGQVNKKNDQLEQRTISPVVAVLQRDKTPVTKCIEKENEEINAGKEHIYKEENDSSQENDMEQDTIAFLQMKYQNKLPML